MKIKLYKSVALCSLLALAGCHDFEELNTNPYAPIYDPTVENVSADGIDIDYTLTEHAMASLKGMEGAIGSIFANFTYEGPYNDYQTTTNLTHDIYAGYWGNNVSGFVNQAPTYSYTDGWSASRWKHFSMMTAALRNTANWSRHSISAIRIITIRHSISPVFIMLSCCPCRRTLTEIFL